MEIKVLYESNSYLAIEGMKLSFETECPLNEIGLANFGNGRARAIVLASQDGGHNKFLESIQVWVDIRASLKFWKQFDTYRCGVTKLSKSTMHTLMKRPVNQSDFSRHLPKVFLNHINKAIAYKDFEKATDLLPSCYLQTRRVCMNYKAIRGIIKQRRKHKLVEWSVFCTEIMNQLQHPELLGDAYDK